MEKEAFIGFEILRGFPAIDHLVSRRETGEPFDFSLALHTGQERRAIRKNRERLRKRFGSRSRLFSVSQVHGDEVYVVGDGADIDNVEAEEVIRADALVTNRKEVILTILTADCVPILLFDPQQEVIAAVHAGWRGSEMRIVAKSVSVMQERYDSSPEAIVAAIGPAIGGCCYEVGDDVAARFGRYPEVVSRVGGKAHLDLKKLNYLQLREAGLKEEHIESSPICTACERERFFSYRGEEGCDGRFASCIMLVDREGSSEEISRAGP